MDMAEEREVIISESVSVGAAVLIDKGVEEKAADDPCWTSTTESRHEVEAQDNLRPIANTMAGQLTSGLQKLATTALSWTFTKKKDTWSMLSKVKF